MRKALFAVIAVLILLMAGWVCSAKNDEGPEDSFPEPPVWNDDYSKEEGFSVVDTVKVYDGGDSVSIPTPVITPVPSEPEAPILSEGEDNSEEGRIGYVGNATALDIEAAALEMVCDSLSYGERVDAFPAYAKGTGGIASGLAYVTDGAYGSVSGETYLGAAFVSTSRIGYETVEIVPLDEAYSVDGYRYVWTDTVETDTAQFVLDSMLCKACVRDSCLSVDVVPLNSEPGSREFSAALKKACDASAPLLDAGNDRWIIPPETEIRCSPLGWDPLYHDIDYNSLKEELKEVIAKQDRNFKKENLDSVYNLCIGALIAYLSETEGYIDMFPLGYLEELKEGLSENDVLTIGPDGLYVFTMTDPPASALERWITGVLCGLVAIASLAAIIALPGLGLGMSAAVISAIAGAALGGSVELFTQITINGTSISNVDWRHVLISVAIGCSTGPFLGELSGVIAGSIGAGVEAAACALIDGQSVSTALLAGCIGLVAGAALGAGAYGAKQIVKAIPHKIPSNDVRIDGKKLNEVPDEMQAKAKYEMGKQKKLSDPAYQSQKGDGYVKSKVIPELLGDRDEAARLILDSISDPDLKKSLQRFVRENADVGNGLPSDLYRNWDNIPEDLRGKYVSNHEQKTRELINFVDNRMSKLEKEYQSLRYTDPGKASEIQNDMSLLNLLRKDAYYALNDWETRPGW